MEWARLWWALLSICLFWWAVHNWRDKFPQSCSSNLRKPCYGWKAIKSLHHKHSSWSDLGLDWPLLCKAQCSYLSLQYSCSHRALKWQRVGMRSSRMGRRDGNWLLKKHKVGLTVGAAHLPCDTWGYSIKGCRVNTGAWSFYSATTNQILWAPVSPPIKL